ncbi:putative F-box/LRR-repeat protein At3g28410 [Raphanus sativus]|uniref:F-box/LRR-repeat protein At3g28410 n=1 Tax=Raphanus sativus TaxID=3726 RepID=A0A6J0LRT7_RAPSA|nr:putative F-box/LRR-repeat protein At3g28410 [Raphanus sativus]
MDRSITEGVDCISSMPDVILHHILSFIPIGLAIRSSALSRRWRHVWCETPRLDFRGYHPMASVRDINQTVASYKAPKITSFHFCVHVWVPELVPQINSWIEFAVSRNVEQLFLSFGCRVNHRTYRFPNSFYRSSSLENLRLDFITIPGCTVSWKSLRSLTLDYCLQSLDDVLSGCPVLETLSLGYSGGVHRLDLSKSPTLTILKITRRLYPWENRGSMEIVAPHLRYLDLLNNDEPCTLVDVSSLTKAKFYIHMLSDPYPYHSYDDDVKADFIRLENMLLKMLAQLGNVEQLTFETTFLQIISLAELRGVPFPMLKVQTLTLHTMIAKSVTPGITRLLQSSPH